MVASARRRFTADEFERMGDAGILHDERVELIDGEVVRMTPIGKRHGGVVDQLSEFLIRTLGDAAIVRVQGAVRLDRHNEVQPDLSILKRVPDYYRSRQPGPADLFWVVEVAQSSRARDRRLKIPLYARMGVREAWLFLLDRRAVEVYRDPSRKGYRDLSELRDGSLSPLAFPDLAVPIAELLP